MLEKAQDTKNMNTNVPVILYTGKSIKITPTTNNVNGNDYFVSCLRLFGSIGNKFES